LEGVAVVFDIFRCSTTIHCLAARAAGLLYVAPSLKEVAGEPRVREMRVFSELSQPVDCLERFDNSPLQASNTPWKIGAASLVATTTGTPAMFAARSFKKVYVGSFVNFSALVRALAEFEGPITLIPAAVPDWQHVEDEIACQAVATALEGFTNIPEFVRECAESALVRIAASPRPALLSKKLATGTDDVKIALDVDRVGDQLLALHFVDSLFAEVRSEN
jgi:phosphosulfolactate phosphohydrolase-like enzyme